jgi:arylsulfatase
VERQRLQPRDEGYRTPNIDRIAKEGAIFTDHYAQQSCTAGRAAFITGQSCFRTGLLKVGLPGAKEGLSDKDPTLGELLKPQGYAAGQFGKNHLGDRNEFLPTVHGFDEFFGNLYHLNAEEEPENPDYPKNPEFRAKFGPRGVLKCKATDRDDPTEDPRFGRVGKQTIDDTGPLTRKRMETVTRSSSPARSTSSTGSTGRARRSSAGSTRPACTSTRTSSRNRRARPAWASRRRHDRARRHGRQLLKKLDDLGIADNTIVVWTTDNGAESSRGPTAARRRSRREEHELGGGYRVPLRDALAGRHQARHRDQPHHVARGLRADARRRPRASRT